MKQEQLDLLIRAQAGEPGAFDEFYEQYYYLVYYFALNLCKNEADAKDVTQETFIRVMKNIQNLRDVKAFQTWIYRIAVSQSNNLFRKNRSVIYEDERLNSYVPEEENIEYIPHKYFSNLSDREIVQGLIASLSEKKRDVLYMFYFDQLSQDEIARTLGISIGTVKTRLFEGRKALKEKVETFERAEGRKISFHFGGILSTIGLYAIISFQKILSKQKYLQVVQATSVVVCAVSATTAIVKTNEILTQPKQVQQTSQSPVLQKEEVPSKAFPSLMYHNQEITSNKKAYFALLDFASDTNELKMKTQEELIEIKPVVDVFLQSEHAYRDQFEQNGWLSTYQSLL